MADGTGVVKEKLSNDNIRAHKPTAWVKEKKRAQSVGQRLNPGLYFLAACVPRQS